MSYLSKKNIADIYPLSPMQKGMLFHAVYDPDSSVYFEQFSCVIEGALDLSCFEGAWNHLIESYPIFRTVFNWKDLDQPVQIVLKTRPAGMDIYDWKGQSAAEQERRLEEFMHEDRSRLFDLAKGPLMRFALIELGEHKWQFVWSYHHILFDGWCLSHIMTDFYLAYAALKDGKPPYRPARPLYKSYIAWLSKQDRDKAQVFWKSLLLGFDTPTPLPWDHKPREGAVNIDKRDITIPADVTARLQEFARSQRITMSTLVQAAWSLLLQRYSNMKDIVFGATVSGRPADLKGSEEIVGLFINTLPVRVGFSQDRSVAELLQDLQRQSMNIREYEYSLLPEVKACSQVSKAQNLFDSIVVFENFPLDSMSLAADDNFKISGIRAVEFTNFDLCLVIAPGDSLHISLSYMTDRFEVHTIDRILNHLVTAMCSLSDDPDKSVSGVEMIGSAERTLLLETFNTTAAPYRDTACIQEMFEEQAARTPEITAMFLGKESMSYSELNARSNQLAHYLRARGVGPGKTVGIFIDRSFEMIIAVLGIIKSGGAYVPIETEYPAARIAYMLSDCGAGLILAQSAAVDRLPAYKGEILCLDRDWDNISRSSSDNPKLINTSRDLVYVIYTSGSTGDPKGIEIEHRGLVNYITWAVSSYEIPRHGTFPLYTSMSFDLTVTSMFAPLICGESIDIMPVGLDPAELVSRVISSPRLDIAKLTPAHLEIADRLTDEEVVKPGRLNRFILGGEALSAKVSRSIQKKYPGTIIYNEYGPAETVVGCIVYAFTELDPDCTNVLIGKPIANTRIYILDADLKLSPIGVVGEICIDSPGVARGYLNKDAVTARSFVGNPFISGSRIYRTGDLGRWLPDGNIEYLGRKDHQVKIRGFRIELGEVESALARYEDIHDCVVVDRTDANSHYLIGYYVSEQEISISELKDFLKASLPEYMVPARFMRLDALPLTPNGKVDRDALPEVDGGRQVTEYVAPRTETETAIAEVWQEVLGVEKIGVNDNFFDLGGDSIISLQVVGRLKKRNLIIRPKDIFENQTVAELALVVRTSVTMKAEQGEVTGSAPLIPIQRWFFSLDLFNTNYFNQSLVFKTSIGIDAQKMCTVLQALLDHHDVLRSRFTKDRMQIYKPVSEKVSFIVKDVPEKERLSDELNTLQSSLDMENGPMFAAGLYRISGAEYLAFVGHHLVVDGVSWRILLEDLMQAYKQAMAGKDIILPEKTTSFKEWALRLAGYAESDTVKEEASFWCAELEQPVPILKGVMTEGNNDLKSLETVRRTLGREETYALLKDAHKAYNTEINDLLLAALMRALADWSRQDTVRFDLEGHGREEVIEGLDITRTVGWFTTLYPVALERRLEDALSTQVKYVKEKLRAIPQKGFNYGVLRYAGLVPDSGSQVLFNYLGQFGKPGVGFELTEEIPSQPGDPANARSHLIDINCKVADEKLLIEIGFSRNRFRLEDIDMLANVYVCEIGNVLAHCLAPESFDITPSDFRLAQIDQEDLDSIYE
jgi:iturin family lipopeptide synthetase B